MTAPLHPGRVLLNLDVTDVDAVHADLLGRAGIEVVLPLRTEDFGQRHFIVAGPDRVLPAGRVRRPVRRGRPPGAATGKGR